MSGNASVLEPEILEVRVHGVQNTPPAEMLETNPEDVRRHIGDELGSFWRRTDETAANGIAATEAFSWGAQARTGGGALAALGRVFVHLGWFLLLPYALANLAYWTRSIRGQESAGAKTWDGDRGAGTVRVFGLLLTLIAVAAFCSVAIDLVAIQCFRGGAEVCAALPTVFDGLRELGRDSRAALLGIAPIATIIVLYAIGRRGRVQFEERVKKFGAELGDTDKEAGLPLLATRGFWSVARIGQTSEWLHVAASITLVLFVLALDSAYVRSDCWRNPSATITESCLVAAWGEQLPFWFGAGALILLIVIVLLVAFASHTKQQGPSKPQSDATQESRSKRNRDAKQKVRATPESRTAWKRGGAMACLLLSIAGYVAWTVITFTPATAASSDGPRFLGLIATPIALIVLALFLALAGVGWKSRPKDAQPSNAADAGAETAADAGASWSTDAATRRSQKSGGQESETTDRTKREPFDVRRSISATLLILGAAALLVSHLDADMLGLRLAHGWQWWLIAAAGVCVVAHLIIAWTAPGNHRFEAWRGQGAAVAMLLALFASMALSSLLVLGVASWLGTPGGSAPTEYIWRTPLAPVPAALWNVPDAYERFAVVLTVIVLLMLVLLVVAVIWHLTRFVSFTLPKLDWKRAEDNDEGETPEDRGGVDGPGTEKYPARIPYPEPQMRRRLLVRRSSHLLHRGEPLFGWLAVFTTIGFLCLSSSFLYEELKDFVAWMSIDPAGIRAASTAVLVAVALAAVGAVSAHAASSSERPLGVFWDVVAFFPRAGHPFAPPCFGERAVPELTARAKSWLNDAAATRPRAVIFTAHSMGSTISAATLLAMRGEKTAGGPLGSETFLVDRSALMSYGTQLRAYFSRFFPSVFGSEVLGVPGLLGPSLWRRDPWHSEVLDEYGLLTPDKDGSREKDEPKQLPPPASENDRTLTALLGAYGDDVPRWRNLWRRTDFLGFPAYAYRSDGNPVDRGATESVSGSYLWRIGTHSDYLGTPQFRLARDDLVRAFGGKPD